MSSEGGDIEAIVNALRDIKQELHDSMRDLHNLLLDLIRELKDR